MHQDPIADLLTRIRNAVMMKQTKLAAPYSNIKAEILKVLESEGYIEGFSRSEKFYGTLKIYLKYKEEMSSISGLQRVSKPGMRIYKGVSEIPKIYGGYGVNILSTSKGVMTDKQARKIGVGGEVICKVW